MKRIFIICILCIASLFFSRIVSAQEDVCQQQDPCAGKTGEDRVRCYEGVVSTCDKAKVTLSSQIAVMNSKIELTTLRINALQSELTKLNTEIDELAGEIVRLEGLLTKRIELVLHRIPEAYKRNSSSSVFGAIFLSSNISDLISRVKYINTVQQEDSQLLLQLKATQNNFSERKDVREKKKVQREQLKVQFEKESNALAVQKQDKQILLVQTNNSEAKYQSLLASARAELVAIQGIIAGQGSETKVGDVKKGDKIAVVINGSSCNSSGAHLHFMVTNGNGETQNPFGYLKSVSYENCSGYSCGSADGDAFNPTGSWDWPIEPTIRFYQGYGSTWAVNHTWVRQIYTFHNGIDIFGTSNDVKAVQDGTLYQGFYSGNCRLQYVKLVHKDSGLMTFYLHINYY